MANFPKDIKRANPQLVSRLDAAKLLLEWPQPRVSGYESFNQSHNPETRNWNPPITVSRLRQAPDGRGDSVASSFRYCQSRTVSPCHS